MQDKKYNEIFSVVLNIPTRAIYIQGEILLDKHQQGQQKRKRTSIGLAYTPYY